MILYSLQTIDELDLVLKYYACIFWPKLVYITFQQYLSSESYSRKYEKLPNIYVQMLPKKCSDMYRPNYVETVE